MTLALGITIAAFVFAIMVQWGAVAYLYGRLTMKVETIGEAVEKKASKENVDSIKTDVDKLAALFEKFLIDVDAKLSKIQEADERDDAKTLGAVNRLEEYVGAVAEWIGERMGTVGYTLTEHERLIRKAMKGSNVSDDRIQAQQGSVSDSGQHRAAAPPPRPGQGRVVTGGFRPIRDPRTE